jgi:ribosome maturation factor RimP
MTDKETLEKKLNSVRQLAEEVAAPMGHAVVETKFGQNGRQRTLEVTIFNKIRPISHNDCEQVSAQLRTKLEDNSNSIELGPFLLEVQSPGIDRRLKTQREFEIFSGQKIEVQTKEKINDLGHNFTGVLLGLNNGQVRISHPQPVSGKGSMFQTDPDIAIEKEKITFIRLFTSKPGGA